MTELTIKQLKELITHLNDDFLVKHETNMKRNVKTTKIEIDMENECIIFK